MTRSKVLIVEDDAAVADSLLLVLEDEGYEVVVAKDGREALDALDAGIAPSAILLDLMMPRVDGYAFRELQLGVPALAAIPTIVMTAGGASHWDRLPSYRFAAALAKPIDLDALLDALRRVCAARSGETPSR